MKAVGRGDVGGGRLHVGDSERQQQLQWCPSKREWVRLRPRDENHAASFLTYEVAHAFHHGRTEQRRGDISQDQHVEPREVFAFDREVLNGRSVLLSVFEISILKQRAQFDRLVSFEQLLQVTELVARKSVREQHANLFFAHADVSRFEVVQFVGFITQRDDFQREVEFTRRGR